ncbi:MAG: flagellar FlbD family protein [Bryobacteraceae bacterium]|nr:flagellar FlbD family protein [Bryobacteraceae bacterium]
MIYLTRINRTPLILNSDLIENIQSTPDTIIGLTSGRNYLVLEPPEEVIDKIVKFRQRLLDRPGVS